MKDLRRYFLMGGIAMGLVFPSSALAEDSEKPAQIDESKPRSERGLQWVDINPNVQAPAAISPVKRAVDKPAAVKSVPVKRAAPANNTAIKPKSPAKPKQQEAAAVQTAVKKLQPKPQISPVNEPGTELVSFQQKDGPVITAKLDRPGNQPKYKVGDKLVLNVKANQDCNVVVLNFDSTGTLTQIFPNDYQQNGFMRAGDTVEIGGEESNFDYQIAGKGGAEKIFIYAYPTSDKMPLPTLTAMAPIAGTPFRGMEMTVDKYKELVNSSQVFFARSVQVTPKKAAPGAGVQLVSQGQKQQSGSPNKVELSFMVETK